MEQTCSYITFKIFFQFLKGWSIIWVVIQVRLGHSLTVKLIYLCQVLIENRVFETSSAKDECWIHKITSTVLMLITRDLLLPWKYLNAGMILFDWLELWQINSSVGNHFLNNHFQPEGSYMRNISYNCVCVCVYTWVCTCVSLLWALDLKVS